jgi:phage tail sheath protein FI
VLTESPTYNGLEKAFTYTLANEVSPNSFAASFQFVENAVRVGTGDATASPAIQLESGAIADDASLSIVIPTTSGAPATETFTAAVGGVLTGDNGGSGTVDFDTGVVTLTMGGGDTSAAAGAITASFRYRAHVVSDDGDGNVSITNTTGPSNFSLDPNGTNSIDYDGSGSAAVLTLTWKDNDNPAAGIPATGAVTITQTADYYTVAALTSVNIDLTGGSDGSALTRSDISSPALVTNDEGLFAMNKTDALAQIVIPDFQADQTVSQDLVDYCEGRKDRFAIVWVPAGLSPNEAVNYKNNKLSKNNSNRAAIYYPQVTIVDPVTEKGTNIPGGGHVAGIYARTDNNRNVSKAPAGVTDGALRGVIGLERTLTLAEVGLLNDNNINCLVQFDFTGRVIWGARTLQGFGGEFPYLQMRRLFMFVEKSVFDSTQIFVFESNTPALRQTIKSQIESFLLTLYNSGHFSGTSPSDAFFVNDLTTVEDVKRGVVRMKIGLAPTRPAEFIEFIFQQKTLENA